MTVVLRIGLALLAAVMLIVGAWNQFWPEHFFANFPTVNLLPPFSEHFARDFGGASLGVGIVLAAAALFPRTILVVPALLAVWAWSLPHFVFHMSELHHAHRRRTRRSSSSRPESPRCCRRCCSSSPCYE